MPAYGIETMKKGLPLKDDIRLRFNPFFFYAVEQVVCCRSGGPVRTTSL
jgi:hypothetical protein